MTRNKPGGENNLLALMRNHGSNKNRMKTRKNEKKQATQKTKMDKTSSKATQKATQKSKMKEAEEKEAAARIAIIKEEATRLAIIKEEYDRKAREWAKRPKYKGDQSKLVLVREPWEPRDDDEYYDREYFLDPKTGNYYDLDYIRLVARTIRTGVRKGDIVPLKRIR